MASRTVNTFSLVGVGNLAGRALLEGGTIATETSRAGRRANGCGGLRARARRTLSRVDVSAWALPSDGTSCAASHYYST